MSNITDFMISSVIRNIDIKKFSETVHGPGRLVKYNAKTKSASIKTRGLLDQFHSNRDTATYFLKNLSKPLAIENIAFTWKNGTNNVSLEFYANILIKIDTSNDDECIAIVEALHHPQGVGVSLYEIIDGHLNKVLSDEYRQCQAMNRDLLSIFYKSGVLSHDSAELDLKVSKSLQSFLNISQFDIGLRMAQLPPQYLEIKCETQLDIRDVENKSYKVKTKADIELSNYQLYKQQDFEDNKLPEQAIKKAIEDDIHREVRKHVFNFSYFELIESFYTSTVESEDEAISKRIEYDIKTAVANKGYKIKLFHTLCDIPPLILIDQGLRITLNPESHQFTTKDSNLRVALNLTINLHLKSFKKVKSLIKPEHDLKSMEKEITEQIFYACKDVINNDTIYAFDLAFDEQIRPKLNKKLNENLAEKYGFVLEIITMQPSLSENKVRLDALTNEARYFKLSISSQADSGMRDALEYQGAYIVTGMYEDGYHRFSSKDYGFCKTSTKRTEAAFQKLANKIKADTGEDIAINTQSFEQEWRKHCIESELENLTQGITLNAEEAFSKESELAIKSRNYNTSEPLRLLTEKIGQKFSSEEFGLKIKVTQFKRLDTATELENQYRRNHDRELRALYLQNDKKSLLDQFTDDASYKKQLHEQKSKSLIRAIAEDEVSREDLENEFGENQDISREHLFSEFDNETSLSNELNKNGSLNILENKKLANLLNDATEVSPTPAEKGINE